MLLGNWRNFPEKRNTNKHTSLHQKIFGKILNAVRSEKKNTNINFKDPFKVLFPYFPLSHFILFFFRSWNWEDPGAAVQLSTPFSTAIIFFVTPNMSRSRRLKWREFFFREKVSQTTLFYSLLYFLRCIIISYRNSSSIRTISRKYFKWIKTENWEKKSRMKKTDKNKIYIYRETFIW